MFLTTVDEETGLLSLDPNQDSWRGIKIFRDFFKKHGLEGITVIAFSADYQTPFRMYDSNDRPRRAMEEIYGDRDKLNVKNQDFQDCLQKYNELQFNADLEQERINNEIKLRYLKNLAEANTTGDDINVSKFTKLLQDHENSIQKFNQRFNKAEALSAAITNSGYKLSRIENDINSRKNSKFVEHGENFKNPNKLNLENV